MYQKIKSNYEDITLDYVVVVESNMIIPFAVDNTDYAKFKVDLSEGAELLDADGNTMSAEQVTEFVNTLP